MSEKIILSVEENKAIEDYKRNYLTLETFIKHHKGFNSEYKSIKDFTIDQMARILYEPGSFEVEKPSFDIDDIVIGLTTGNIYKITHKLKDGFYKTKKNTGNEEYIAHNDSVRLATPKEIIFAELGREVGEFVDGDIGIDDENTKWGMPDNLNEVYGKGNLKGFYPSESYISFGKP